MRSAFTLIELLIVVAIIAILAAIAVPNFLEAQTRAKVSRTKADMRTMATGLETYMVDHNAYPNCHSYGTAMRNYISGSPTDPLILERLSTPIAYLTNAHLRDPFKVARRLSAANAMGLQTATPIAVTPDTDVVAAINSYIYQAFNGNQRFTAPADNYSNPSLSTNATTYIYHSCGPDSTYYNLGGVLSTDTAASLPYTINMIYDPTNGTVSVGSIFRAGGVVSYTPTYAGGVGLLLAIQRQP